MTARQQLNLAKKHLERVQLAWDPPDWANLAMYGFYCLENAVSAAATHAGIKFARTHPSKADAARQLAARHSLPDVSSLLVQLTVMMLESRWPTAISGCQISMLKMWQSKSRSTSTLWRFFLPVKSRPQTTRGSGGAALVLETVRSWPSSQAKRWVLAFVKKVCPQPNTRAVIAIGSIVRVPRVVQDADFIYIYKSHRTDLSDHPLDVDVRIYDGDQVPGLIAAGHDLLGWAMRYGRLICEHDHYWTHLQALWQMNPPLPDPAIAEMRASKAEASYRELRRLGDLDAAHEQLISLLTHKAWARLLRANVYPASRPELPEQLRSIGDQSLARRLAKALLERELAVRETVQQHAAAAGASRRR